MDGLRRAMAQDCFAGFALPIDRPLSGPCPALPLSPMMGYLSTVAWQVPDHPGYPTSPNVTFSSAPTLVSNSFHS